MHKLVRRGKEGARRGRLTKQHTHKPLRPSVGLVLHCLPNWATGRELNISSALLFVSLSCLGGVLVPELLPMEAQKKQIFVFALRACGAILALFTRTGRCPLAYYLVLTFLSLSQRDLHKQVFFSGLVLHAHSTAYFSHCFWICKVL